MKLNSNLRARDVLSMKVAEIVSLVNEVNKPPGGIMTLNEIITHAHISNKTKVLEMYGYPCNTTVQAVSGYEEEPNTTDALYIMPVLRGDASFIIQNSNNYPINVTFSLLYVGEYFANTTIDTAYTGGSELPKHLNNSTKPLNYLIHTPLEKLYVGDNITLGGFTIVLYGLSQPNQDNVSSALINIYYQNALTNTTQLSPGSSEFFQIGNQKLKVDVNQTFYGLYAYEKWATLMVTLNTSS